MLFKNIKDLHNTMSVNVWGIDVTERKIDKEIVHDGNEGNVKFIEDNPITLKYLEQMLIEHSFIPIKLYWVSPKGNDDDVCIGEVTDDNKVSLLTNALHLTLASSKRCYFYFTDRENRVLPFVLDNQTMPIFTNLRTYPDMDIVLHGFIQTNHVVVK